MNPRIASFLLVCPLLCGIALAQPSGLAERFDQADQNGDGKVTEEELPRPKLFRRLDRNGDGVIEKSELTGGAAPGSAGAAAAPDAETKLDVAYGEHERQKLDIYLPGETDDDAEAAPIMVYVHGGGWHRGDKSRVGEKAAFFTGRGWAFVSVNYRLLPEGKHPTNVEDVALALAWVHDHATEGGGDPDRIFLMGHSAGAHLAALAATSPAPLEKAGKSRAIVKGVIPIDTNAYDIPELMESAAGLYPQVFGEDPETWKDASPATHVEKDVGIAPFLIPYSRGMGAQVNSDRAARANAFAGVLEAAGIPATVVDASDRNHGEINQWFGRDDDETVTGAAIEFLDGILAESGSETSSESEAAAGLDPIALGKLDVTLQWHVDQGNVSGVVGLVHRNGHRGYFEAYGKRDIEAGDPMEKDAIFRLKSMSKPIVTVAALQLVDEGALELDDPIGEHLPEWKEPKVVQWEGDPVPAKRAITARMLMSHSSGLYYQLPGQTPFSGMPPRDETTTLAEYSKALASQPLAFHPGEDFRYGTSIDVLGRLVEVVAGKPLDVFLRERLFEPLGMEDTDFWVPEEKQDRLAQLYQRGRDRSLSPATERYPATKKPALFMGGAGLCGTTADYERFCLMLLNDGELDGVRILETGTVDAMFRNQLADIGKAYGLGGGVDGKGSYAWGGANGTKFWIDRSGQVFAVFMIQAQRYRPSTYNDFQGLVREAVGAPSGGIRPGGDAPGR